MPATVPTPSSPHATYSLDQCDTLYRHAHRVVLYSTLVANVLEGECKPGEGFTEELLELVSEIIADAQAVETVLAQGDHVAEKGGA